MARGSGSAPPWTAR